MQRDPELTGIPADRLATHQKVSGRRLKNYRNAVMKDLIAWSIVAVPSAKWAKKVFPQLTEER